MDCFERNAFEDFFAKEEMDIVRWDKVDSGVLAGIFGEERLRLAAESLVNYFISIRGRGDMQKKLGRYLYPAGNFDNMLLFLRCAVGAEERDNAIEQLKRSFEGDNSYNEPLWIIWGRFLTDALDVLRQWECIDDKAIDRIVKSF